MPVGRLEPVLSRLRGSVSDPEDDPVWDREAGLEEAEEPPKKPMIFSTRDFFFGFVS